MRGVERMVNWSSGEVGKDNCSESPGVVRRGAMAPHWPGNRVYLFPVTSGVLRPERIWYALPNWQWVVLTRHRVQVKLVKIWGMRPWTESKLVVLFGKG